jgi:RNA polymerase sigma-70 factor (ECF subfamily)
MTIDVKTVVQVLMQQRDRLFAYIWAIVGDLQLAEDTLQELSLLAVEKGPEVQDEARLVVWLRRAARLKALEMLRQRGRTPLALGESVLDQLESHWVDQERHAEADVVRALEECLNQLTPNNRRILAMRYAEGKKTGDIAIALGRKLPTVYQSLVRVHRALRQCIEAKLKLLEETAHE